MNKWKHGGYITEPDRKKRRDKLALHVKEVADYLLSFQSRGLDGMNYARQNVNEYLKSIRSELEAMDTGTDRPRKPRFAVLK